MYEAKGERASHIYLLRAEIKERQAHRRRKRRIRRRVSPNRPADTCYDCLVRTP